MSESASTVNTASESPDQSESSPAATSDLPSGAAATESEWDEKTFARLVGFDDDDLDDDDFEEGGDTYATVESSLSNGQVTDTALEESAEADLDMPPPPADENVLSDEELFDSPHDNPTQTKLSGNPFAKLTMVGVGLFLAFGTAGFFLTRIMGAGSQIGTRNDTPIAETSPEDIEEPVVEDNTEGQLKTEMALARQAEELRQREENDTEDNSALQPNNDDTNNEATDSPTPPETPPRPVPPTTTAVARPVRPAPPPPAPRPAVPTPRLPTTPQAEPAPTPAEQLDQSLAQWQTLSQLGSYRRSQQTNVVNASPPAASPPAIAQIIPQQPQTVAQTVAPFQPTIQQTNLPLQSQPVQLPASNPTAATNPVVSPSTPNSGVQQSVATNPPAFPYFSNTPIANAPNPAENRPQPLPQSATPGPLVAAENRVLQGIPIRRANIGLNTSGILTTPIIGAETNTDQRFVVTLAAPLVNESEQVLLDTSTPIVFRLNMIQDNGLIEAAAISVLQRGVEMPLPAGALVLRSTKGPLIAQNASVDSGGSRQLETMFWGAVTKLGEAIADSGEESTFFSNGNSTFSSTSSDGDSNLLGAIIQGAASPVLEQITEEVNQRNAQALERADLASLWYLPVGEDVQVYVNLPMEFY